MKKKICIITSSFPSQMDPSAGIFVKDFALLLAEENCEVFVLAPQSNQLKDNFSKIKLHYFPWIGGDIGLSSYNVKNPVHFLKLSSAIVSGLFSTLNLVRKNKIDVCIAMWAVPSGFFALAAKILFQTPYFVWSLGSDIWTIQKYPFGKLILKKVLKNAKKLYADGFQLARDVEQISKRNCKFLAINRLFDMTLRDIKYAKFDHTKINFMYLGRYHKNKGIDLLIKAIALLSVKEKNKTLFHIFGGGPMESKIKTMVKELNLEYNTFINDYLDGSQVFSYMSKSDFIVIPSRIESIPVVLSDVMKSKKPVILTNVGDMGDLASQYRIGFLVEPAASSIAAGLRLAIKSDKNELYSFQPGMQGLKNFLDIKKSIKTLMKNME